jgi:hypothetical protein
MGQKIHTKDSGVGVVTPAFIVPQVDPATGKVYRMSNDEYQVAMEGYSVLSGTAWDGTNKKVTLSGKSFYRAFFQPHSWGADRNAGQCRITYPKHKFCLHPHRHRCQRIIYRCLL